MTTHSMTEAEVLSDRIAIFSGGKILCNGSISFLREKFGRGYQLTVDRGILHRVGDLLKIFDRLLISEVTISYVFLQFKNYYCK